jgi:hypothetical protein
VSQIFRHQSSGMGGGPDRAIIDQSHLHHGLEFSILHSVRNIAVLNFLDEIVIQSLRLIPAQSTVEVRLAALRCLSKQGELGY